MKKWKNLFYPKIIKKLEKAKEMIVSHRFTWSGDVQY